MASGTLTQKLRPIRIGFLVNPHDESSIQKAIHLNSLLWGGMFNPLIPCYKRLPSTWSDIKYNGETANNVIRGFINNYDPDFFVNLSELPDDSFGTEKNKFISEDKILKGVSTNYTSQIGIGLFEVLNQYIHDELRFLPREKTQFLNPQINNDYKLFLSSLYGDLGDFENFFYKQALSSFDSIKANINTSNYLDYLQPEYIFSRRINCKFLNVHLWGPALFYMDAEKTIDVIDFWNLRASGCAVYPIIKQTVHEIAIKEFSTNLIENEYAPYSQNQSIYRRAKIIKSRNTTQKELDTFLSSLTFNKEPIASHDHLYELGHYPRLWELKSESEQIITSYSDEVEVGFQDNNNEIRFKPLKPKIEFFDTYRIHPSYAVEVESTKYGTKDLLAEVIPQGENVSFTIGSFHCWRASRRGPVCLVESIDSFQWYKQPLAEEVMKAWFLDRGWKIKLSTSGKIAKQMLEQLDGLWGVGKLKQKELIQLFQLLNTKNFISETDLKQRISKMINENNLQTSSKYYIQRLIEDKIFQLGVQLICPRCNQKSWYSLESISYDINCTSCLSKYSINEIELDEKQWAYKALGTFSLPKQAYGAYSVLLTLHVLSRDHDYRTTPLLSFDVSKGNKNLEADLCLIIEEKFSQKVTQELIFAECKTYNKFEKKDISRMKDIASEFPNAALVFATMRDELTNREKLLIRTLIKKAEHNKQIREAHNPIIVLTNTELFSRGIPFCWREKIVSQGEILKDFHPRSLNEIADITQQLYLA